MPTTRKKIVKTVYKDEAESEEETGDFSDSGSDAKISEAPSSDDEIVDEGSGSSSGDDFRGSTKNKKKVTVKPPIRRRKAKFAKDFVNKINSQVPTNADEDNELPVSQFSVKDLTDADKLLPSFLNLSESDSSDDESQSKSKKKSAATSSAQEHYFENDDDKTEYKDVWSNNIQDNSEDIAKKTFLELEKHKTEIEQTKASIDDYVSKNQAKQSDVSKTSASEFNVDDLLAQGEDVIEDMSDEKKAKARKRRDNSESDMEDWEEVNEAKSIPQQGLQLFVELPNATKKSKKLDIEMMMKRKINRVKKEHQVYMHQVHVLCWIGHGNYVNQILNDQEIMAAALAMVPKGCYPEERVTTKYLEQITTWFKDKLRLKQDKNEHKFKPKAPPLKNILLEQIKSKVTKAKKYNVFIFVAMLRALGLQCRVMINFVTLPIRPPNSELCSLSMKKEDPNKAFDNSKEKAIEKSAEKVKVKKTKRIAKCSKKIAQVDGICDSTSESDTDVDDIMQLDGNDDAQTKSRKTRSTRAKKVETIPENEVNNDVSPPKRAKKDGTEALNQSKPKGKAAKSTNKDINNIKMEKNLTHDNVLEFDVPPEVPKSSLRKRSVRNKNAKLNIIGNETSKPLNDNQSKNVSLEVNTQAPQKSSKKQNKDDISKTANDKTAESIHKMVEPKTRKGGRSVPNKDNAATEKQSNNLETKNKDSNKNQNNTNAKRAKKFIVSKISPSNQASDSDNSHQIVVDSLNSRQIRTERRDAKTTAPENNTTKVQNIPNIVVTDENLEKHESNFFSEKTEPTKRMSLSRKRSHTNVNTIQKLDDTKTKVRAKSAPGNSIEKSKYFESDEGLPKKPKLDRARQKKIDQIKEDKLRVSHRDLINKVKPKNDVTEDLVDIIKNRIKAEKAESKKGIVKGKKCDDSGEDSDFLPVEDPITQNDSDEDFKPAKISPRPLKLASKIAKKLDRRVLSSDDENVKQNKVNVWCEVFVEELEQWIAIDVIKGKVHCTDDLYTNATHPVCYIVGWDNNNYLKDLTRRYVAHWNTVTRKQRAGPEWWRKAIEPWLGPKTARDKEEDEQLDRMQLEAPLPKSIAEYKNHPLYALKRHLLKFEALYPPDAATLGFVRGEAVYSRDCVYICQSRDKWLKDAKVVRLGEEPYKIVKARPKWDRLSNKCITDKPLEVFGPWQVQDYEPPTAENGIVPRNAYGNVELFKPSMLPKKTVHIKLPGLQKIAKKLNIDCAPAMTGFDYSGGYSHPVYDGAVVCEEFEEIITEAWLKDQEEQERKEVEKMEIRVYGNWKRLIRGLMIRERLKLKYGFEEPSTSQPKSKKGPRLVVKKK